MKPRLIVVSLFVIGALVACGGEDNGSSKTTVEGEATRTTEKATSADDQAYVDALVAGLEKDAGSGGPGFEHDQNVCIAEGIVNIIGSQAFADAGIDPAALSDNQNTSLPEVTDAQHEALRQLLFDGTCVDMKAPIADLFGSSMSGAATTEQITCLTEAVIANESMQNYIVDGLLGKDTTAIEAELGTVVQTAAADCGITG